ncbi:MAG: hypothetical protein ACK54K_15515 [Gemmatimonadaceae bacterium]|jgi:hypothetical protein
MRRLIRPVVGALWAGALALQMGCYAFLPVQSAPPAQPQREIGIVINDRGRTLLSERVGPLVERIDGRIDKRENGVVTMAVFRVTDVRGESSTWTGEQVAIPEEAILGYRPKKISKFKTALLVGALALAVVLTLGTSLDLFGVPTEGPPGGGPSQS